MSVWSFQGGMHLVREFKVEGYYFIDKNLPRKKARTCSRSPHLGAELKLKTRPLTLSLIHSFLDTFKIPLLSFFTCVGGGGHRMMVEEVGPDSGPSSAPDLLVLTLPEHVGYFWGFFLSVKWG